PGLAQLRFRDSISTDLRIPCLQRAEAGQGGIRWPWARRPFETLKLRHPRPLAVVEGVRIPGLEVDEPGKSARVRCGDGAHFRAGDRVPDEHGPFDLERIHDGHNVVTEAIRHMLRRREARGSEAAPRDAVDMPVGGEPGRELVEYVRRVSAPGQEDDGSA